MGLGGLPLWEAASVFTAPAPQTPTPTLPSSSLSSPTRRTPTILCPLILPRQPLCSSPDVMLPGGTGGLSPLSSLSCSGAPASPPPTRTQERGVALGQGGLSLGGLEPVVAEGWTTETAMARLQVPMPSCWPRFSPSSNPARTELTWMKRQTM